MFSSDVQDFKNPYRFSCLRFQSPSLNSSLTKHVLLGISATIASALIVIGILGMLAQQGTPLATSLQSMQGLEWGGSFFLIIGGMTIGSGIIYYLKKRKIFAPPQKPRPLEKNLYTQSFRMKEATHQQFLQFCKSGTFPLKKEEDKDYTGFYIVRDSSSSGILKKTIFAYNLWLWTHEIAEFSGVDIVQNEDKKKIEELVAKQYLDITDRVDPITFVPYVNVEKMIQNSKSQ